MSQHDLEIANQTFPATRSDLNNALQALGTLQSGATAPSTTYANQLWYDTTNDILYLRNEADDAWIEVFDVNQTSDVIELTSKLKAPNGSSSLPSITFDSDTDSGLYRSAANTIGMTLGGNDNYEFTSTGSTTISGTGAFLVIDDTNGTTANTVNAVRFDASGASAGYVGMSGSSTLLLKNYNTTGGLIDFVVDSSTVMQVSETNVALSAATVTGTTPTTGDSTTKVATTAFVQQEITANAYGDSDVKDLFNASGESSPFFAARAYVNFDGTVASPTISTQGNVSGVTRTATGKYTVTFSTAMPDTNYIVMAQAVGSTSNGRELSAYEVTKSTTNVTIECAREETETFVNADSINVIIFG